VVLDKINFQRRMWAVCEASALDLSRLPPGQIKNHYAAKVRPGKHSLILPLGARATLIFPIEQNRLLSAKKPYLLELTDISGTIWSQEISGTHAVKGGPYPR